MRKSILPLMLACLGLANSAMATTVTMQDAQNVGLTFFKVNVPQAPATVTATWVYTVAEASGTPDYYVFGISPGKGFVIVAADDAIEPVIGYSSESSFDPSPAAMMGLGDWMKTAAGKISGAIQNHVTADATIANEWMAYRNGIDPNAGRSGSVAPLCATTWNQSPYYNADCPGSGSSQAVTGCVATAMAQIMKFWNYPATGTGSFSYSDEVSNGDQKNYGTLSANFGATTYAWTSMPNSISSANASIATLMYQCGVSVAMDYSPSGSGAWVLQSEAGAGKPCAQNSYVAYFGYASSIQGVKYASYTSSAWITLLEAELNAGRPVEYQGTDPSAGGHTWVCDGYNTSNQMHMNWGWGGVDNGYFAVTNLSVGGYTFSSDDGALIGIQPASASACSVASGLASSAISASGATLSWTAVTGASSYNLQYKTSAATTWTTVSVTGTSQALTGLSASTTYDYQVQTVCASGSSAYSAAATFTTSSLGTSCGVPSGLASSAISSTAATVSWTAVSGATSYNLQYKTAAATTWTTVSVTTTSKALTGLSAGTTYDYQVATVCSSGTSAYSTASTFATTSTLSYCASHGNSGTYEWISDVELGSINHTGSAVSGGYINTGLSTNLMIGSTDTIYFSAGFTSTVYKEYWAVYIDYNNNGVFTDAGEEVVSGSTPATAGTYYATFTVPSGLTTGAVRMRVIMDHTSISSPCATFNRGEVEDFTVDLSNVALLLGDGSGNAHNNALPLGQADESPMETIMSLYPNPAQSSITVNTYSDNSNQSVISVFDLTGRKVISEERQNAIGYNAQEINVSALPSGIYIMEQVNNGVVSRQKFTISK